MADLNSRPGDARPQTPKPCLSQTVQKAGFSVSEFCFGAGIGRSKAYDLMKEKRISFVTVGRRRIITTSPADFLAGMAGNAGN